VPRNVTLVLCSPPADTLAFLTACRVPAMLRLAPVTGPASSDADV
jgi:hypothetical protein